MGHRMRPSPLAPIYGHFYDAMMNDALSADPGISKTRMEGQWMAPNLETPNWFQPVMRLRAILKLMK